MRQKSISGIRKRIVAKCFTNDEGKKPSPMSSVEQVAKGVDHLLEIVVADAESDEFITVDNDVQLIISQAEVGPLAKQTNKYLIRIDLKIRYCL